jgi:hypothetical protein
MPHWNETDLKLRDLRDLEVMLTEGSLTRAAARLNTTQPSLSKALARLRTHFEDPLLVRDGQIMRATPMGAGMLARPFANCLVQRMVSEMPPTVVSILRPPIASSGCSSAMSAWCCFCPR